MGIKIHLKMDSIDEILLKRGLNKNGKAQQFFTTEIARHANPYVPFKTGNLKDIQVRVLPEQIQYLAPYAQRQYYSNKGMGKEGISRGGMRGKQWITRMWADQGKNIVSSVNKFVGGR